MSLDGLERPSRTGQPSSRTKIRYSNRRATKPDHAGQAVGTSGQRRTQVTPIAEFSAPTGSRQRADPAPGERNAAAAWS